MKYWSHLGSASHRSDIHLPFFHLKGDGFWHLKTKPGVESVVSSFKPKSLTALRELIQYAYLDERLFELFQDSAFRSSLVNILTTTWFSDKTQQIEYLFQVDSFQDFQDRLREQGGAVYTVEDLKDEEKSVVRDAAFRRIVVSIYQNHCAFCGLYVVSSLGQNIVDGAHIKPFSEFRDDRIDNGMSLCKNHHWAFDRGWFSVNDDYTILIASDLREESPNAKPMQVFHGEPILLPMQSSYFPRIEALRWHRENKFNQISPFCFEDGS